MTAWEVHSGTYNKRYPWWVGRINADGETEYHANKSGEVHKFKNLDTAKGVARRLQVTADFNDSREHARLAVHHMLRATDGLQPDHPLLDTVVRMADLYLELTGVQL